MFVQIGNVLPIFRVYEKLFRNHERLMEAITLVFFDIMRFCVSAKNVFRKGKRRAKHPPLSRR
jgi:hypothetical protein